MARSPSPDRYGLERRYDRAIALMRPRSAGGRGYSRQRAIRTAGITPKAFEDLNYARQEAVYERRGPRGGKTPRWRLREEGWARLWTLTEEQGPTHLTVQLRESRTLGDYGWQLRALQENRPADFGKFRGRVVVDAQGRTWHLIGDEDAVRASLGSLTPAQQEDFSEHFYELIRRMGAGGLAA